MEKLLEVKDLVTQFFTEDGIVQALDGVSFHVNKGETFALVGETGCGKSVTMLSVLRLIPQPGKILGGQTLYYNEEVKKELGITKEGPIDLLKLSGRQMRHIRGNNITLITQDPMTSLNPVYTAGDQITEVPLTHRKVSKEEARKKMEDILELMQLVPPDEIARKYPHQLSGGERQRIVGAISLIADPDMIVADEPTTNLDVTIQARILEMLIDLKDKLGTTLVFITHNLGLVAETSDRVGVMYAGNVVEEGGIFEIFDTPIHPYTQGLLAAVPNPKEKDKPLKFIPGTVPNLIHPPSGCRFHPRCSYATEICSKKKPEFRKVKRGRFVACHHAEKFL
jgi:peptide/nickel transport system ATP-binding protein